MNTDCNVRENIVIISPSLANNKKKDEEPTTEEETTRTPDDASVLVSVHGQEDQRMIRPDQTGPALKSILRKSSNDGGNCPESPPTNNNTGGGIFRAFRRRSSVQSSSSSWSSNPQDCGEYDPVAAASAMPVQSQDPDHYQAANNNNNNSGSNGNNNNPTMNRRVNFEDDPVSSVQASSSSWTAKEIRSVFWSKKEIRNIVTRAQRLADDIAFRRDRKIIACLHVCYGFPHPDQTVRRFSNHGNGSRINTTVNGAAGNSSDNDVLHSPQLALQYYYRFETPEPEDDDNSSTASTCITTTETCTDSSLDAMATTRAATTFSTTLAATDLSPPESPSTASTGLVGTTENSMIANTTLRGLERQLSIAIVDYQMQCTQAVLTAQAKILADSEPWTPKQKQWALYKQSTQATAQAKRFARLLGKADASIVGCKSDRSSRVPPPSPSPKHFMNRRAQPSPQVTPQSPAITFSSVSQQEQLEQQQQMQELGYEIQTTDHEQREDTCRASIDRRSSERSAGRLVIPYPWF